MKLSTKARYGTRAMAELAASYPDATVSVHDVAGRQNISPKYLEHILSALKAAGLVRAVRGMNGGYELVRPPADISLGEIFRVFEGSVAFVECVENPAACPLEDRCPTRETWVEMKDALNAILKRTTLQDLVERQRRKSHSAAPMYHI